MSIGTSFFRGCLALVLAGATLLLSACGGGGGEAGNAATSSVPGVSVDFSGLAATGAPIVNSTVTVINARGEKAQGQSNASGNFTVKIAEGAPYLLSVVDGTGRTWYSYAQGAGRANINPLTTLALLQAHGHKPLADLAAGWASQPLAPESVLEAAKVLNANLASLMDNRGVAANDTNVFIAEFDANGTGLDAVLDAMRVRIDCSPSRCTETITSPTGSILLTWNASIATDGFSLSWSRSSSGGGTTGGSIGVGVGSCRAPRAGTWSLVVTTTVSGLGSQPVPEICIDGLPDKPSGQSQFCGDSTVNQQLPAGVLVLSCSYDGTSGTISARLGGALPIEYSLRFTFIRR